MLSFLPAETEPIQTCAMNDADVCALTEILKEEDHDEDEEEEKEEEKKEKKNNFDDETKATDEILKKNYQ